MNELIIRNGLIVRGPISGSEITSSNGGILGQAQFIGDHQFLQTVFINSSLSIADQIFADDLGNLKANGTITCSYLSASAIQSRLFGTASWTENTVNAISTVFASQSAYATQSLYATRSIQSAYATSSLFASQSAYATQSLNATRSIQSNFATQSLYATNSLNANNADLLDNNDGTFYQNASNLNAGYVLSARLSGSYNITASLSSTASLANNALLLSGNNAAFYQNASNLNAGYILPVRLSGSYNITASYLYGTALLRSSMSFELDNTYDIGTSTYGRPRDVFVAGNVESAKVLTPIISSSIVTFASNRIHFQNPVTGIFIGTNAGASATNGNFSIMIGYGAGSSANSIANSIFIGTNTAQNANLNENSVIIGALAGVNYDGGNTITAIGYRAAAIAKTGSFSTFIGAYTDVVNSLSDAAYSTAIGHGARIASGSTIILGGTGSVSKKVGIGTFDPQAQLHVVGTIISTDITASLYGSSSYAVSSSLARTASLASNALLLSNNNAAFYQNASNLNAGYVLPARLSGSYNITASLSITASNALTLNNVYAAGNLGDEYWLEIPSRGGSKITFYEPTSEYQFEVPIRAPEFYGSASYAHIAKTLNNVFTAGTIPDEYYLQVGENTDSKINFIDTIGRYVFNVPIRSPGFEGTASWANAVQSSSYASTASFVLGSAISGSVVSSSYSLSSSFAQSSSLARTASFANNALLASTASLASNALLLSNNNAAFYQNASNLNAGYVLPARLSGSYNITSSLSSTASYLPSGTPLKFGDSTLFAETGLTIDGTIVFDVNSTVTSYSPITASAGISSSKVIVAPTFKGDLQGTASWANTASYALTASILRNQTSVEIISANSGATVIDSQATGSYRAAFYNYVLYQGTNSRCGIFFTTWNGSSVTYAEHTTTDIGNTEMVTFRSQPEIDGTISIYADVGSGNWTIKAEGKYL